MKKIILTIFALISVVSVSFTFGGCGNDTDETIEVRGQFYLLDQAYESGWLNEDDLKSIACGYYDFFQFDKYTEYENLYSGMFDPHEELSKKIENELKQAYLEQSVGEPEGSIDCIKIKQYYGTYSENVVVSMSCDHIKADKKVEEQCFIGNVVFYKFCRSDIIVYHID